MASRGAGTLLTEFNAAYVHPGLMPGTHNNRPLESFAAEAHRVALKAHNYKYQGHVPSVAFSFGSPYGTATLKYFQDQRNAALEKSHTPFSRGGHFPTLFSSNPDLVLSKRAHIQDRWLHTPVYTRFNLDSDRSAQLMGFYQTAQQHRKYYLDKTGMVPQVPYFVLPVKEWERYPLPTDFPPLTPEKKWHLLRVSPENLKTYQMFPSGKRVSPHERQKRDRYFEFRA